MTEVQTTVDGASKLKIDIPFPEYPNAKPLLVAAPRPRAFLERAARELIAGGTEELVLSAMGDAISNCVNLALTLVEKEAVVIVKIVTERNSFVNRSYTPSLRILVVKHPNFKGSRTPPAYVQFVQKTDLTDNELTAENSMRAATVIIGTPDFTVSPQTNDAFIKQLNQEGINPQDFEKLISECFTSSLAKSKQSIAGKTETPTPLSQRAQVLENPSLFLPNTKAAMCRLGLPGKENVGSVFLVAHSNPNNPNSNHTWVIAYVAAPKPENYNNNDEFVADVEQCSVNLMTALCDFNGLAQREGQRLRIKRVPLCRVPLWYSPNETLKVPAEQLALATLKGMDKGYCHGPSPRILYIDENHIYRKIWTELTGLEPVESNSNSRNKPVKK